MMPGARDATLDRFAASVIRYNSLIHGDPLAGQQSLLQVSERESSYALDRDYSSPDRAHSIASETSLVVVFLVVLIDFIFPKSPSGCGPCDYAVP